MTPGSRFGIAVCSLQLMFIVIYAFYVVYDVDSDASDPKNNRNTVTGEEFRNPPKSEKSDYSMFQDIHAMVFFGIGFLLTFLKKYGYTGLGMNMLLAVISIQMSIIVGSLWGTIDGKIQISIKSLIYADFAAASALIALGGVFGKISPLQMVVFTLVETTMYMTNEYLCITALKVTDLGASIYLHLFAALFGLSVAFAVDKNKVVSENPNESTTYMSNLFCLLGTVFLWAFWPSFNSIVATEGDERNRSVINTYCALLSSCVTTFAVSSLLDKENKFNVVHVQNATLAGGVAIGAVANLMIQPAGALGIGAIGGCISVVGYKYITPFLAKYLNVYDPCGINSLHMIPGMLSGIIGTIAVLFASEDNYGYSLYVLYPAMAPPENTTALVEIQSKFSGVMAGNGRSSQQQAYFQLAYIAVTTIMAVISGLFTGTLLRLSLFQPLISNQMYLDDVFWKTPAKVPSDQNGTKSNDHIGITKF